MKEITLYRNGQNVKVPVLYTIFDISAGIFDEPFETPAKSTRDALLKYLKSKNRKENFVRSGNKQCEYCVSPLFYDEGTRYRAGKRVWYKVL